jgi:hypothetical protein
VKQLIALAILTLPLMGFSCEGPEGRKLYQTVFGEVAARNVALTLGEDAGEVEVAVVEPYVEPEPPACVDELRRGRWYDCNGNWLRDVE